MTKEEVKYYSDLGQEYDDLIKAGVVFTEVKLSKIKPKYVTIKIRGAEPKFTYYNYADADRKFRQLLDNKEFSDLEYIVEFEDGEVLEGVIDSEPRSFFAGVNNPLTRHLNTFWVNLSKSDKPYDKKESVDYAKKLVSKYDLGAESKAEDTKKHSTFFPFGSKEKAKEFHKLALNAIGGKNFAINQDVTTKLAKYADEYLFDSIEDKEKVLLVYDTFDDGITTKKTHHSNPQIGEVWHINNERNKETVTVKNIFEIGGGTVYFNYDLHPENNGNLSIKDFKRQFVKHKEPKEKPITETIELPVHITDFISLLNKEHDPKVKAVLWNEKRGLTLPKTYRTLWQVSIGKPYLEVAEAGEASRINFSGNDLMRAIVADYKSKGFGVTETKTEPKFTTPDPVANKIASEEGLKNVTNTFIDALQTPFKGINHSYKNQYELNKAIEALLTEKAFGYNSDEKNFIRKYSGYGGLDKYGTTGKGGLFEYYTPKEIIERMWALAYKYGYKNGSVLEPSVATGEFFQYAPKDIRMVGYEINNFSAQICKILYPTADIFLQPFEQLFIKNNFTMKDKTDSLEKFDLVIGNPPYGDFSIVESRYMSGMGEKDHTKARNYVEYFIRRGLDLLKPNGLLIYIVGAQIKNGGKMFLDGDSTPVKEYLAANCEFLDAYRLPDSVFERTGVTADIIVLKKN